VQSSPGYIASKAIIANIVKARVLRSRAEFRVAPKIIREMVQNGAKWRKKLQRKLAAKKRTDWVRFTPMAVNVSGIFRVGSTGTGLRMDADGCERGRPKLQAQDGKFSVHGWSLARGGEVSS
jgi:hypothetical protein